MVLPSLADALIVVILLIPGFITFSIIRWLGNYGSKLSEFKITITSFSFSMVILFFYTLITGITNLDVLRDKFFMPENFLVLFGITLAVGFGVGMNLRRRRQNYDRLDTWQKTITTSKIARWVLIITKNENEYKGTLISAGIDQTKDVLISNPKQIIRNDVQEVISEIEFEKQILFKEDDIARIVFLT